MAELEIALLGPLEVRVAGAPPLRLASRNVQALLAYLAVEHGTAHTRARLALLLWPDQPKDRAYESLRQALYQLRGAIPPGSLLCTRLDVRFQLATGCRLDVVHFHQAIAAVQRHAHPWGSPCPACIEHLEQAAALYRGDFLAHVPLPESELFAEWALLKREWLQREALGAFYQLAAHYTEQGDYARAYACAWRQVELDPPREEAHRQVMQILALRGQRSEALAHYDRCRRLLADLLDAEPSAETVTLYTRIRSGEVKPSPPPATMSSQVHSVALAPQQVDWGEAPDVSMFVGRHDELDRLQQWVKIDRCRLVGIFGMGGIGKSTLATCLCVQTQPDFEFVLWRSLRNAPPLLDVLGQCVRFFSNQAIQDLPARTGRQVALLIDLLRQRRCLLILDNFEAILDEDSYAGRFRAGYDEYGQLLRLVAETSHQSCLLVTSREKPHEFAPHEGERSPVRALSLSSLNVHEGRLLLHDKGLHGTDETWQTLVARYSGNPLALQLVAETIRDLYHGHIDHFLADETAVFGGIRTLLAQQFARLAAVEQELMAWCAIAREPVTMDQLRSFLAQPVPRKTLLEALQSLHRRFLLEKTPSGFTLQNVVMEFVTGTLVDQVCAELEGLHTGSVQAAAGSPSMTSWPDAYLNRLALLQAQAREYVRETQVRLLLHPVRDRLLGRLGAAGCQARLDALLASLHSHTPCPPGYAGANLLHLFLAAGVDLQGYDFSHLAIWQAHLRDVALPGVNFAGADLTSTVFADSFGAVTYVAISPDGAWLAAGTYDGEVRLWQVQDYRLCAIFHIHGPAWCVAFSPDSLLLAACGGEATIRLWEVRTGSLRLRLEGHTEWVWRLAFRADGAALASAGSEHTVHIWDTQTGQLIRSLHGHTGAVLSVAWSAWGDTLASCGADASIRVWQPQTGQLRYVLSGHDGLVGDVAISPDGRTIASAGYDLTVRLWDAESGQPRHLLHGHTSRVTSVAFSPDGASLISCAGDHTLRLWHVHDGRPWQTLHGHGNIVVRGIFSPDGEAVYSCSYDQTVRVWELRNGLATRTIRGHTNWIVALAYSPDGKTLASGSYDHLVRLWDAGASRQTRILRGQANWVLVVAFSPDGTHIAAGGIDGTIRIWEGASGRLLQTLSGHTSWVTSLAYSPDGITLASGSVDQTICLWDVASGWRRQVIRDLAGAVWAVAISPDGATLASGGYELGVRLWSLAGGQLLHTLHGHANWVDCLAFSPDGSLLASAGHDHTICLWDMGSHERRETLHGHQNRVAALAFHPDGVRLVSGSDDHTVCIWDVYRGECIHALRDHTGGVEAVAVSPDGVTLASCGADATIRLWDLVSGMCRSTLRLAGPYAGLNLTNATGLTEAQMAMLRELGAVVGSQ